MRIQLFITTFLILFTGFLSHAQNAYLDTTFNPLGPVKGKFSFNYSPSDRGSAAITDPIGRLLTVSYDTAAKRIFVSRRLLDGSFDGSFINGGTYTSTHTAGQSAYCIVRQPDGKFLIGGGRRTGIGANPMRAFLFRLNQDGTLDAGFGEKTFDFGAGNLQEIKAIEVLSNGNIIVAGINSGIGLFVARIRSNGDLDTGFNFPSGYFLHPHNSMYFGGLTVNSDNEILFAGNRIYTNGEVYIYKLRSDGTSDLSFNNNTGFIALATPGVSYTSGGIKYLPGGKFLLGGIYAWMFTIHRFLPDGTPDNSFGNSNNGRAMSTHSGSATNFIIDSRGKLIITGSGGSASFAAIRFNFNGSVDTTFATNGLFTEPSSTFGPCLGSCVTPDDKIVLIGFENDPAPVNTPSTVIMRLSNRPIFNVIGNDIVLPKSAEKYEVSVPSSWPATYTYQWDYTGTNAYFITGNTGKNNFIFFSETATGGVLKCTARNQSGITVGTTWINVKINNNPSQANLLAELQCPREITDCYNNYIDFFELGLIKNDSTDCNATGYSDFTKSLYSDTLIAGAVYSAKIRAESSDPLKYAAIWIDYNNDGIFNSTDEFVQQTSGPGPMLSLNNIILKNQEEYTGPKRMRIRCSPSPFSPTQACQTAGESGETEDYMIVIQSHEGLKAPGIITPNDDGKNDYFVIRGIDPKVDNKLTIMDRYGNVVYAISKYENNWDGKDTSGSKVTPGTYYYYFDNNGDNIRGFVEVRY